ncbi:portal protein [Bacillus phage vB_BpsS-140]|nr:portal protein [Bacillus phage vB_BpsS-140]
MLMGNIKEVFIKMGLLERKLKHVSELKGISYDSEYFNRVKLWENMYKGFDKSYHEVKYGTVSGIKKRNLRRMNMAKVVSHEMASIIFNEKAQISITDEKFDEYVQDLLEDNGFFENFQRYLEYGFATGGFVIKPYYDAVKDKLKLSYIAHGSYVPTSWDNNGITGMAFFNNINKGDKFYTHIEFHKWQRSHAFDEETGRMEPKDVYVVENSLYMSQRKEELGEKIELSVLFDGLEESVVFHDITQSLFVYFKPNTANNIDTNSPMGISIFADAIDTLYSLDVAFDSYNREFRLGKRRLLVPRTAIRVTPDEYGNLTRTYDPDDEVLESLDMGGGIDAQKIHDSTVDIRAEEHLDSINGYLDILCMQTGFSGGTFVFDGKSMKTATEVISENSKTFRTKQSHEHIIEGGIKRLVVIIAELTSMFDLHDVPEEFDTIVKFDDSVTEDNSAKEKRIIELVREGLESKKRAIMEIHGVDDDEAMKIIEEINAEKKMAFESMASDMTSDDDLFGETE